MRSHQLYRTNYFEASGGKKLYMTGILHELTHRLTLPLSVDIKDLAKHRDSVTRFPTSTKTPGSGRQAAPGDSEPAVAASAWAHRRHSSYHAIS